MNQSTVTGMFQVALLTIEGSWKQRQSISAEEWVSSDVFTQWNLYSSENE